MVAEVLEAEDESDSEEEGEGPLEKFFHRLRSFPVESSSAPRARAASVRASNLARRVVWKRIGALDESEGGGEEKRMLGEHRRGWLSIFGVGAE